MGLPSIFVYTHDSVGLGEDGPTHQPIEHLAALRAIPHLVTIRPADANETAAAWRVAIGRTPRPHRPGAHPPGPAHPRRAPPPVERGAYVLADGDDCILIGTGSEVHVALAARELLAARRASRPAS